MRSRRSPLAALPLLLALLAIGCGSGGTTVGGGNEPAGGARSPAGVAAGRVRSARRAARLPAAKGIESAKDAQTDRQTRHPPRRQRRLRRVRRDARGGAGAPDPQRGARRRGDRPAPAHRRPPDRRRAQSDRDLPPGAGLEILSEGRRVSPARSACCCSSSGSSRSRASCGGRRSRERRRFPSDVGGIMALVGALALYAVATLMRGERWLHILRRSEVDATRADALRARARRLHGQQRAAGARRRAAAHLPARQQSADDEAHDPRHDPRRARARRGRARRDPRRARRPACCAGCRSRTRRSCWSASALVVLLALGAAVAFLRYRERLVFVLRALAPMAAAEQAAAEPLRARAAASSRC